MSRLSAPSRSLLRLLWRSGRKLEQEIECIARAQEEPAVAKLQLTQLYYHGLVRTIHAVPSPAWSVQHSTSFRFSDVQSKIMHVESYGRSCAHEVTRILGERLIMDCDVPDGSTDSEHNLLDVGFSILRDMSARKSSLLQMRESLSREKTQLVPFSSTHDSEEASIFELAPSQRGHIRQHAES